jgi:hypothetical protein
MNNSHHQTIHNLVDDAAYDIHMTTVLLCSYSDEAACCMGSRHYGMAEGGDGRRYGG